MARVFRTINFNMTIMLIIYLPYLPKFLIFSDVYMVAFPENSSASCVVVQQQAILYWVAVSVAVSPLHDTRDFWRNMFYYNQSLFCSLDSRKICYCPCWSYATIGLYLDQVRRSDIARPLLFDLDLLLRPLKKYFHLTKLIARRKR